VGFLSSLFKSKIFLSKISPEENVMTEKCPKTQKRASHPPVPHPGPLEQRAESRPKMSDSLAFFKSSSPCVMKAVTGYES